MQQAETADETLDYQHCVVTMQSIVLRKFWPIGTACDIQKSSKNVTQNLQFPSGTWCVTKVSTRPYR